MSRSRHQDEDDDRLEDESGLEGGETGDDELGVARRLRPAELMFSTTGRIAIGVFGVLLFLGGVIAVSSYLFRDDATLTKATAKKTSADKSKQTKSSGTAGSQGTTDKSLASPMETSFLPPESGDDGTGQGNTVAQPAAYTSPSAKRDRYDDYADPYAGSSPPADTAPVPLAEEMAPAPLTSDPPIGDNSEPETIEPDKAPAVVPEPLAAPLVTPASVYQVRDGETLFDIARYELGNAARWIEIYKLNAAVLGERLDALPAGTSLRLPAR